MFGRLAAGVLALLTIAALGGPAEAQQQVQLVTRPGVSQSFWVVEPSEPPVASVVLLVGGNGLVNRLPPVLQRGNFLSRSRDLFAAQGFLVAIPDVPSDQPSGLTGFRGSADHATDLAAVIAWLRQKSPAPVWLIGTSLGTISAANAAARLKTGGPDGLVLTSSIIVPSRREGSVRASVDVSTITLPTLFVHNREDACQLCPFDSIGVLIEGFTHAPRKELLAFSGGDPPKSDPCEALSRHGYLGIEHEVVAGIGRWIKGG